jgi:ribosomal-protein-alanine N-acetyltransferase
MNYTLDILHKKYAYGIIQLSSKIFNIFERFSSLESVHIYENKGFVAKDNEKIIGYLTFSILYEDIESKIPRFTITSIGVDPEYRKQGIGKNLIREVRNYFRKTYGYMKTVHNIQDIIYLQVRLSNHPAKALYDSSGFEMFDVIENYYKDPDESAIYMRYKMGLTSL